MYEKIRKLGTNSRGLTCFVEDGTLCYEYNLFTIHRTKIRATKNLPRGKVKIEVETAYAVPQPAGPLNITTKVNGEALSTGHVPPLLFTANDCLDIGIVQGSPVSLDCYDKAPFKFKGTIGQVPVQYVTRQRSSWPLLITFRYADCVVGWRHNPAYPKFLLHRARTKAAASGRNSDGSRRSRWGSASGVEAPVGE